MERGRTVQGWWRMGAGCFWDSSRLSAGWGSDASRDSTEMGPSHWETPKHLSFPGPLSALQPPPDLQESCWLRRPDGEMVRTDCPEKKRERGEPCLGAEPLREVVAPAAPSAAITQAPTVQGHYARGQQGIKHDPCPQGGWQTTVCPPAPSQLWQRWRFSLGTYWGAEPSRGAARVFGQLTLSSWGSLLKTTFQEVVPLEKVEMPQRSTAAVFNLHIHI